MRCAAEKQFSSAAVQQCSSAAVQQRSSVAVQRWSSAAGLTLRRKGRVRGEEGAGADPDEAPLLLSHHSLHLLAPLPLPLPAPLPLLLPPDTPLPVLLPLDTPESFLPPALPSLDETTIWNKASITETPVPEIYIYIFLFFSFYISEKLKKNWL